MKNLGFTSYDFHILCCLSSWATCGSRKPGKDKPDDVVPKQNLPSETTSQGDGGKEENDDYFLETKCEEGHGTDVDEGSCIRYVPLCRLFYSQYFQTSKNT